MITDAIREVDLHGRAAGRLLLSAMPGRYGPLGVFLDAAESMRVSRIVDLTAPGEAAEKSPGYHALLVAGGPDIPRESFPVADFGVPGDPASFAALAAGAAREILSGGVVLLHCGAGIGRTGLAAAAVLMAIGFDRESALSETARAGSGPETPGQLEFLRAVEMSLAEGRQG